MSSSCLLSFLCVCSAMFASFCSASLSTLVCWSTLFFLLIYRFISVHILVHSDSCLLIFSFTSLKLLCFLSCFLSCSSSLCPPPPPPRLSIPCFIALPARSLFPLALRTYSKTSTTNSRRALHKPGPLQFSLWCRILGLPSSEGESARGSASEKGRSRFCQVNEEREEKAFRQRQRETERERRRERGGGWEWTHEQDIHMQHREISI